MLYRNLPALLSTAFSSGWSDEDTDRELGYRIREVEAGIKPVPGAELWQSKGSRVFQTPYRELHSMMEALLPGPGEAPSGIVDLGTGYGRLGIVVAGGFPGTRFVGLEISPERVAEARRVYGLLGLDPGQVVEADLSCPDFVPPEADAYLIYDYGTRDSVQKTLEDLKRISRARSSRGAPGIRVIGRGRLSRDLIERGHPWLSQVHPPRHLGNYSIYSS